VNLAQPVPALLAGLAACAALVGCAAPSSSSSSGAAPAFQVDTAWPQPLPNNWILGQVSGVAVDANDHVWVLQRPRSLTEDEGGAALNPPHSKCCVAAPPVLELDARARCSRSWGGAGAGYDWPGNEHGIHVDRRASSGSPATARTTARS
jgi:hypothetical protein